MIKSDRIRRQAAVALLATVTSLSAAEPATPPQPEGDGATWDHPMWNVRTPTLGGRQFWGDVQHFRGWRIQQHVLTGHYRLLNPQNVRHAWGSLATCEAELARQKVSCRLPPLEGRAVILAHGILRSSRVFHRMQDDLHAAGWQVIPFDYPSTRVTIPEAAAYLRRVIDSLDGVQQIDFVGHSLGGLIVRCYLQQTADRPDPRLHRIVMLGVPNAGARMADLLQGNLLFDLLFGPAGRQLVEADDGFIASLPPPPLEFAVIAGARGMPAGFNPLIPGDDDGVVSVQSALLPGAADSLLVPCLHTFLPMRSDVITACATFLDSGALRTDGLRHPVSPRTPSPLSTNPLEQGGQESLKLKT